MESLARGSLAPDFRTVDQDGGAVRLADARGRTVVLFFYPEDDTPGCTAEACGFRDARAAFDAAGALVWGVSTQDRASHARFAAKHGLGFPLLVDDGGYITRAYGAMGRDGYARRVTFVLGPDGRVAEVVPGVDPARHAGEILEVVRRLHAANPAR